MEIEFLFYIIEKANFLFYNSSMFYDTGGDSFSPPPSWKIRGGGGSNSPSSFKISPFSLDPFLLQNNLFLNLFTKGSETAGEKRRSRRSLKKQKSPGKKTPSKKSASANESNNSEAGGSTTTPVNVKRNKFGETFLHQMAKKGDLAKVDIFSIPV